VIIFKKISFIILLTIICILRTEAGIKDAIFATVGDKAITHSDITNEIKINLVLSNISFSEEKRDQIQSAAIRSAIKRAIKRIEIDKYDNLTFNKDDLKKELLKLAGSLSVDLDTFKNIFTTNGVDFSIVENQVKTELLWNSLIFELYKNRLSINAAEIEEQLKSAQNEKKTKEFLLSEIIIRPVPKNELKSKIEEIKNKIKLESFKSVALNSSISETALRGGDLGWINENVISEELRSKIVNTSIGNITEPIILPEGILFIKVRDIRKIDKFKTLEELKNQLIMAEKTKILNMHSLSHYDGLRRSVSINYY